LFLIDCIREKFCLQISWQPQDVSETQNGAASVFLYFYYVKMTMYAWNSKIRATPECEILGQLMQVGVESGMVSKKEEQAKYKTVNTRTRF
jgi:hypothetical protein